MKRGMCLAALLGACAAPPKSPSAGAPKHCAYTARIASERPLVLDVEVSCRGRAFSGLAAAESTARAAGVREVTSDRGRVQPNGRFFELMTPTDAVRFRYRIDLDAVARSSRSVDGALRQGDALISPASTFLLHPLPLDTNTEVTLEVRETQDLGFATGLERAGAHYRLSAHEIPVATYAVFGRFARERVPVDAGRAHLDLVVLGDDFTLPDAALRSWVEERAAWLSAFYGGFPARRTFIAIVPSAGQTRVHFGKLLPESAPGIALLLGADATLAELRDDWVLLHELFHIGVPSFHREGKWFDEGLATYYEPILRARAGLLEETSAWRELRSGMARGLPALTQEGLTNTQSYAGIYWGGAIYCLLADVEIRARSEGRLGLEDGLRRVRAEGGHSSDVWPLEETLAVADSAFERPLLRELKERYAVRPTALDLDALFEPLGVRWDGHSVTLDEHAPLAWVRRAIIRGGPLKRSAPALRSKVRAQ